MSEHSAEHEPSDQSNALTEANRQAIVEIVTRLQSLPGALLPILHGVQDSLGYVPPSTVPIIANALNLSRAEVHGVISFYHHFRSQPPGRHVLRLCRAEACQAMGAAAIEHHVRERLGINFRETSADGSVTLEAVYCLGNCACAPSLMIDDQVHGRLTTERVDSILDRYSHPA
ncbi:MAG: formate dehydrogenase subunit gamma [Dokdonella sp.]